MRKIFRTLLNSIVIAMMFGMVTLAAEYTVTETNATLYTNDNAVVYLDADVNKASDCVLPKGTEIIVTGVTSNGFWQVNINNATFYLVGSALTETTPSAQSGTVSNQYILSEDDCWTYALDSVATLRKSLKNPYSLILDSCYGGSIIYNNKLWYIVNISYYATNSFGAYVDGDYLVTYNVTDGKVAYGDETIALNEDYYWATILYTEASRGVDYYSKYVMYFDTNTINAILGI